MHCCCTARRGVPGPGRKGACSRGVIPGWADGTLRGLSLCPTPTPCRFSNQTEPCSRTRNGSLRDRQLAPDILLAGIVLVCRRLDSLIKVHAPDAICQRSHPVFRKHTEQQREVRTTVGVLGTGGPPSSHAPSSEDLVNMPRRSTTFLPDMAVCEGATRSRQVYRAFRIQEASCHGAVAQHPRSCPLLAPSGDNESTRVRQISGHGRCHVVKVLQMEG